MQLTKKSAFILIIVFIIWILAILNIIFRWFFISSELYVITEFFIYLLSVLSIIWGVIQVKRHQTIVVSLFILLLITVLFVPTITYMGYPERVKLYMDFYLNFEARKKIAIKMVESYYESIKDNKQPEHQLWLDKKQKYLTNNGIVEIWTDRGCVEVDFKLYNGSPHHYLDYFNYGKSGYLVYVTDESKFNLKGATIRHIVHTQKISDSWYYIQLDY